MTLAQKPRAGGDHWFRLDNAAKLYPAIENSKWSSLFRVSMVMGDQVDASRLELAVNQVLPRFPSFKVRLRKGMFWYYLEDNDQPFHVAKDEGHPCMRMRRGENNGYLFRVLHYQSRISLEVFHALTDGTGGLVFLKTLAAQYLRLGGAEIPPGYGILDLNEKPVKEELEDAYRKIPLNGAHFSRREARAFHLKGIWEMPHTLHLVSASLSVAALKAEAKKYHATITEYLTAVFLFSIYMIQQREKRDCRAPVKVSVPVNMRRFVPTQTLRNFAFYINVGIDPALGKYAFPEVVELCRHYMRYYMNPKFLFAGIATNVASERNALIRVCPLFVKNFVLNFVYHRVGESLFTTTLSNLGAVELPLSMLPYVKRVEMMLGAASSGRSNCGAVSLQDELVLTFSRNIREPSLEREILCFLVEQGIPVTVGSNQE